MRIRPATATDAGAIAALHAASWRHAYRGALRDEFLDGDVLADRLALWGARLGRPDPAQYVIVGQVGDELAGFACAYAHADPAFGARLDNLHVAPSRHRQGLGRQLLEAVAAWVRTVEPDAAWYLWVLASNAGAQRFYSAHGGVIVGSDLWHPPGGGPPAVRYRMAWNPRRMPPAAHS
jgi:GNAT superfamily N-acetyltransferase